MLDAEVRFVAEDGGVKALAARNLVGATPPFAGPIRSIPAYQGMRHYDGYYWSATARKHLRYESLLERDRMLIADFDSTVTEMVAQPFMTKLPAEGRSITRFPDLLLLRGSAVWVVDVKSESQLSQSSGAREALETTRSFVHALGWNYEVWTGAPAAFVGNVRRLGRVRHGRVSGSAVDAAAHLLPDLTPLETLFRHTSQHARVDDATARAACEWLLWSGTWVTDLDTPLSNGHLVSRS